jgi:hypothetical protein
MPYVLEDKGRDYKRLQHTPEEQQRINRAGFTTVLSSNVSAIAEMNGDLYIRFHGGSSYVYPGSGNLYDDMLNSSSKGKFVWRELRRNSVPYQRIANVRIPNDVADRDMNLPRREILNEASNELMDYLVSQNIDIVKELERSNMQPRDIKTLITAEGIYKRDATIPNTRVSNLALILNEIELTKIFPFIIA